jgi:hypothetical protein
MVWFFAIPAANTPLRTGASPPLVRRGIQSALDVIREMSIKDHVRTARIAPRLELQVACLLLLRNAYPAAYRVAKALRARIRAKR